MSRFKACPRCADDCGVTQTTGMPAAGEVRDAAVLVGRQGIYDRTRTLAAFELLFRAGGGPADLSSEADHERATSQVISSVFGVFGVADISGDKPLFVNFSRAFVTGRLQVPDVPKQIVVEVLEHVVVDEELLAGVSDLRERGFHVAVDRWDGDMAREELLRRADIVKIDLSRVDLGRLPDLVRTIRGLHPGGAVVLESVEDEQQMQVGLELGVDFFQGFHLNRPQTVTTRSFTTSDLVCLRLLGALAQGAETVEVERLVASDPGLALRVLRTASSPGHAAHPITSLTQAIVLLGPRALSAWVSLMLVGSDGRVPYDDVVAMLTRAGACAALVPAERDVAYTAGLLCAVAAVLGGDLASVVRSSGVGEQVSSAVLEGEGPVGRALQAVLGHDAGDAEAVVRAGFTPLAVSLAVLGALGSARRTADATRPV